MHHMGWRGQLETGRLVWTNRWFCVEKSHFSEDIRKNESLLLEQI
jgi:hypothetical protein